MKRCRVLVPLDGSGFSRAALPAVRHLLRPADLKVLRGDNTKLHTETGWKPEIPLDTTLRDLLDHWRSRPDGVGSPGGA